MHLDASNNSHFFVEIKEILAAARQKAYSAINTAMVEAYWLIGKRIVEEEQKGEKRAEYGEALLASLSQELTSSFGKGFTERNLRYFRQFYVAFPDEEIRHTLCAKLSWSHIRLIMRVKNKECVKVENFYSISFLETLSLISSKSEFTLSSFGGPPAW